MTVPYMFWFKNKKDCMYGWSRGQTDKAVTKISVEPTEIATWCHIVAGRQCWESNIVHVPDALDQSAKDLYQRILKSLHPCLSLILEKQILTFDLYVWQWLLSYWFISGLWHTVLLILIFVPTYFNIPPLTTKFKARIGRIIANFDKRPLHVTLTWSHSISATSW